MKIPANTRALIKKFFVASFTPEQIKEHRERLKLDPKVKDLEMRLRWDCLWSLKRYSVEFEAILTRLHTDRTINDDHIDSVLKQIFKEQGW